MEVGVESLGLVDILWLRSQSTDRSLESNTGILEALAASIGVGRPKLTRSVTKGQ